MPLDADFLVIGAGVVGLSLGVELLNQFPKSKVVVIDKEEKLGAHASGRNSGVLHAGFYYSPDSLKARFCREGNEELRKLIYDNQIPMKALGKIVVAKNKLESERLESLHQRGLINGVKLELLPESDLKSFEPLAKTHEKFLWSPDTAVSDPTKVLAALATKFEAKGGILLLAKRVSVKEDKSVWIDSRKVKFNHVFNSAGVNAVHIANTLGLGREYGLLPVLGIYKTNSIKNLPLRTLVYPVPDPVNPFLGVHFTVTVDGLVKIGPTAIPVLGREQYGPNYRPDFLDIKSTSKSLHALLSNSFQETLRISITEISKFSSRKLLKESSSLVPLASSTSGWTRKPPGLRAQLVNLNTGQFEQDFVVRTEDCFTHILNAVSPGWTAAIPFSKWVVSQFASTQSD
jgi:L-2-hydroxyglutarate oxidase LhgO